MWSNDTVEWVDIELTSYCNISCPGCLRQVKRDRVGSILDKDILTFENIKKWVTKKEFPNLKLVNFCGSIDEPTLHPEILDIVDYFAPQLQVNISTNGSTKTVPFWSKLGEHKISVFFGLDGIDQESLERYRVGASFKKVQKNWRAFISAGGKATWQFIVFDHNQHLIDQAKDMAAIEGFENFRTIYSHREGHDESKAVQRDEEQEIVCKYGDQKRIFISHTGALLPCCFLNSEHLDLVVQNYPKSSYGEKYLELGGVLSNHLKYNMASEVIHGDLFKHVVDSWQTTKPVEKCWHTCKKAKQDVFIHEELK